MLMTSFKQIKLNIVIIHLLLFVLLIGFSFSSLHKIDENLNITIDTNKIIIEDFSVLENEHLFSEIKSKLEYECLENEENFINTFTYKFIIEIKNKVIISNNENISMKKINEITDILIRQISIISENNYNNEFFYKTILNLIVIFSNYKNNDLNFENFNEKIIPIIYKILNEEINEYSNDKINSTKRKFLQDFLYEMSLFLTYKENIYFFFNLIKNEKLKELFINIIDECINFVIKDKNDIINYLNLINNFFNDLVLETITNNYSCKKVYFELIDHSIKHFDEILNTEILTDRCFYFIKRFLDKLFKNPFYLENIVNLDTFINIFKKINDI